MCTLWLAYPCQLGQMQIHKAWKCENENGAKLELRKLRCCTPAMVESIIECLKEYIKVCVNSALIMRRQPLTRSNGATGHTNPRQSWLGWEGDPSTWDKFFPNKQAMICINVSIFSTYFSKICRSTWTERWTFGRSFPHFGQTLTANQPLFWAL